MDKDFVLTTTDNPYDPFKEWNKWYKYDIVNGYDCCGLVARTAPTSSNYSDEKNLQIIEETIDEIVKREPILYKKVIKE